MKIEINSEEITREQYHLVSQIKEYGRRGNKQAALSVYLKAIKNEPNNQIYYHHMVGAAEDCKDLPLVREVFYKAIENKGYNASFLNAAITAAGHLESFEVVREFYFYITTKLNFKFNPKDLNDFLTVLMIAASNADDITLATNLYQGIKAPPSLQFLTAFIKITGDHNQLSLAEEAYKKGINLEPKNQYIYHHFIFAARQCREIQKAVEVYRECKKNGAVNYHIISLMTSIAVDEKDIPLLKEIYPYVQENPHFLKKEIINFHQKILLVAYKDEELLSLIFWGIEKVFNGNQENLAILRHLFRDAWRKTPIPNRAMTPKPVKLTDDEMVQPKEILQKIKEAGTQHNLKEVKTLFEMSLQWGYTDASILNHTLHLLNIHKEYRKANDYYNLPELAGVWNTTTHSIMAQIGVNAHDLNCFLQAFTNGKQAFKALNSRLDIDNNSFDPFTPYSSSYVNFLNNACLSYGYLKQMHDTIEIYQYLENNKAANAQTFVNMIKVLILFDKENLIAQYYLASIQYAAECSLNFIETHSFLLQQQKPWLLKLVYENAIKGKTTDPQLRLLFRSTQLELLDQLETGQLDLEDCKIFMQVAGDSAAIDIVIVIYNYSLSKTDWSLHLLMIKIASKNSREDLVDFAFRNALAQNGGQLNDEIHLTFQEAKSLLAGANRGSIQNPASSPTFPLTQESFINPSEEKESSDLSSEPGVNLHVRREQERRTTQTSPSYEQKNEGPVDSLADNPYSFLRRATSSPPPQESNKPREPEQSVHRDGLAELVKKFGLSNYQKGILKLEHFREDNPSLINFRNANT